MAPWSSIPTEVWVQVINGLYLPELLQLSLSCTRLRDICRQRFQAHMQLRREYYIFNYGDHRWNKNHPAAQVHGFPFHKLLVSVLANPMVSHYVTVLEGYGEIRILGEPHDWKGTPILSEKEKRHIHIEVQASPWIHKEEKEQYFQNVCLGDEDATLCVLLPLLPNLRSVSLPEWSRVLDTFVGRIASASVRRLAENISTGTLLPLGKVVYVTAKTDDGNGTSLEEIVPWAALPSVRRITVYCLRNDTFAGWPEGVPHSVVPEVYFMESCISAAAVRDFAKGFDAPCIMRQHYSTDHLRIHNDEHFEWDHCVIDGEVDPMTGRIQEGSRSETVEARHKADDFEDSFWYSDPHEGWTFRRLSGASDLMNAMLMGQVDKWKDLVSE